MHVHSYGHEYDGGHKHEHFQPQFRTRALIHSWTPHEHELEEDHIHEHIHELDICAWHTLHVIVMITNIICYWCYCKGFVFGIIFAAHCSAPIVAVMHLACVMVSWLVYFDFRWNRCVLFQLGSSINLLPFRRRTLYICYDSWHMSIGDIIQGPLQTPWRKM